MYTEPPAGGREATLQGDALSGLSVNFFCLSGQKKLVNAAARRLEARGYRMYGAAGGRRRGVSFMAKPFVVRVECEFPSTRKTKNGPRFRRRCSDACAKEIIKETREVSWMETERLQMCHCANTYRWRRSLDVTLRAKPCVCACVC